MTDTGSEVDCVVVEREMPHPPDKVWRVLTEPHLIGEWLTENDFKPVVGHLFTLEFDWGVVDCRVLAVEPQRALSYTWMSGELESVVTWTLNPTGRGTHLRMEQNGFRPDQPRYYHGARAGWPRFFAGIENVLTRMD
ncbi:MAG TPA: SRPBCC domain-containing protein [Arenicellales bacterium]|nr:SRPBCC domain-containing protein [Arenicellales bacterium]